MFIVTEYAALTINSLIIVHINDIYKALEGGGGSQYPISL